MSEEKDFKIDWEEGKGSETECKAGEAFDQLLYCWTVGKQLKSIYRYGKKQNCSQYWDKLKLCSKVKLYSSEQREAAIKQFNDELQEKKNPNQI